MAQLSKVARVALETKSTSNRQTEDSRMRNCDTQSPSKHQRRSGNLTAASTITPRASRRAWEEDDKDRIPAVALTLTAGREGTGKSSSGIWLTTQVFTGALLAVHERRPRNGIHLPIEDAWTYTLTPRLMAAGTDLDRVFRFDVTDDDQVAGLVASGVCEVKIGLHDIEGGAQ